MDADRDALTGESRALQAALRRFPTRRAWLASAGGAALAARLERHLDVVRRFAPAPPLLSPAQAESDPRPHDGASGSASPDRSDLQVVQWNVLHGTRFEGLLRALQEEPALGGADLVALEETDLGLARSGNRDVAFELARALGMHAAWTPLFLEIEGSRMRSAPGST